MRTIIAAVLLASWPAASFAAQIHVPADQPTIQQAIVAAAPGDEILVTPGTYHESLDLLGKAVTVRGAAGAAATIVDGAGLGTVVRCVSGETQNTWLDELTITNATLGIGEYGVLCTGSSPLFSHCVIRDIKFTTGECSLSQQGIAVRVDGGAPQFVECAIEDNVVTLGCAKAMISGVALHVVNSADVTLVHCSVARNTIVQSGPSSHAIVVMNSSLALIHCVVEDNVPGAILGGDSHLVLDASVVRRNLKRPAIQMGGSTGTALVEVMRSEIVGHAEGGLLLAFAASAHVAHSTIADNGSASPAFGYDIGAFFLWSGTAVVEDSIVFGQGMKLPTAQGTVSYSDVSGGWPGVGNLALDPKFVAPAAFDYRIGSGSPCIDTANPAGAPDPDGTLPDQGAHPYEPWQQVEAGIGGALHGTGTLTPNTKYVVSLEALPSSLFVIVYGTSAQSVPVPFGTLVPVPTFVLHGFMTDAQGAASFEGRWPSGVSTGKTIVIQAFVLTPVGWTPTDALIGVEP